MIKHAVDQRFLMWRSYFCCISNSTTLRITRWIQHLHLFSSATFHCYSCSSNAFRVWSLL